MNKIKELISELKHILEWSQPISRYNEILGIVNSIEIELEPKVKETVVETPKVESPKSETIIKTPKVEAPKVDEIVVETPKVEDSKQKSQGRKK